MRGRRHGFTLVELLCGLSITAVVMTALAGVVLAVSANWRGSDPARASQLQADQSARRVQTLLQQARLAGRISSGSFDSSAAQSAAVLLWAGDANGDGTIQLSELLLLEHDRSAGALLLYQVRFPPGLSDTERLALDPTVSYDSILEADAPAVFKSMSHVTARPLVAHVTGARFLLHSVPSERRPAIEFAIRMNHGGTEAMAYGSALLRAAGPEPAL